MGKIESFRDLQAYQESCVLDYAVFIETKGWPAEEKFALVDQVRRSSRAIGANLAEAWAKRRYPAHFVSKLTDADGLRLGGPTARKASFKKRNIGWDELRRMVICLRREPPNYRICA